MFVTLFTLYKLSGLEDIIQLEDNTMLNIKQAENDINIPQKYIRNGNHKTEDVSTAVEEEEENSGFDTNNKENTMQNIPEMEGEHLNIQNIHIKYDIITTQNVTQAGRNPLNIPQYHISYDDINSDGPNTFSFKHVCNNTRPNVLLIYKNMWHYVFDGQNMLSVGRAFYDDRSITGKSPVIRIPAVITYAPFRQYCHLWYKDVDHSFSRPVSHVQKFYLKTMLNDTAYGQAIYTCPLPDVAQLPSHVSLTTSECYSSDASNRNTMMIPVTIPEHPNKFEHEFGVCVAISYNRIIPDQFVEWIEFYHMFGVTEFNIYNASVSSEFDHIFQVFMKQTMVHVSKST